MLRTSGEERPQAQQGPKSSMLGGRIWVFIVFLEVVAVFFGVVLFEFGEGGVWGDEFDVDVDFVSIGQFLEVGFGGGVFDVLEDFDGGVELVCGFHFDKPGGQVVDVNKVDVHKEAFV